MKLNTLLKYRNKSFFVISFYTQHVDYQIAALEDWEWSPRK